MEYLHLPTPSPVSTLPPVIQVLTTPTAVRALTAVGG